MPQYLAPSPPADYLDEYVESLLNDLDAHKDQLLHAECVLIHGYRAIHDGGQRRLTELELLGIEEMHEMLDLADPPAE